MRDKRRIMPSWLTGEAALRDPLAAILATWMPAIFEIANREMGETAAGAAIDHLRASLLDVTRGGEGVASPLVRWLPRVGVGSRGHGLIVESPDALNAMRRGRLLVFTSEKDLRAFAEKHQEALHAVVKLLAGNQQIASRLRRCHQCGRFFFGRAAFKRTKFCVDNRDKCRRAWDHAHRDPKKQTIYMRKYRSQQRQRKRKTR